MRKTLSLLALTFVFFLVPCRAHASWCTPFRIDAGFKIWFNIQPVGQVPPVQLAPWYLYFPYEAHFQTPSPMGYYPHWPMPGVPGMYQATQPMPTPFSPVHPAGYYYSPAPSYWYPR